MRPVPESARADDLYGPFLHGDEDLLDRLTAMGEQVRELVPACFGLSFSVLEEGVTFTVVASAEEVALLDAVQYVDGGPCADALDQQDVIATVQSESMEARWALFGTAAASVGVASTLSLPLLDDGQRVGGFNLYASTADAFEGQHESLADILGAWAEGAVVDGDLPFRSRELARRAPRLLRDSTQLSIAASMLAQARDLSVEDATQRLRRAAVRAAVPLPLLVDRMVEVLQDR